MLDLQGGGRLLGFWLCKSPYQSLSVCKYNNLDRNLYKPLPYDSLLWSDCLFNR